MLQNLRQHVSWFLVFGESTFDEKLYPKAAKIYSVIKGEFVDWQLNVYNRAGKTHSVTFFTKSRIHNVVLQNITKYNVISYLSPTSRPHLEFFHTCTKNNWLLLYCLTKAQINLIYEFHMTFAAISQGKVLFPIEKLLDPHSSNGAYVILQNLSCIQ